MAQFCVFAGKVLVGYTMLEHGDPPMGVAFGKFEPVPAYAAIRHVCATNQVDQSDLGLSVQTEAGFVIPCIGVGVLECSAEPQPSEAEVHVLGVPYPLYGELFPEHVGSYEQQFPSNRAGA